MSTIKTIGVVVFDGIERLDFEGPCEVLGWARQYTNEKFEFHFVSVGGKPIKDHLLHKPVPVEGRTEDHDGFDLLLIPGGDLAQFYHNKRLVEEITRLAHGSKIVASVCTGAFLVAQTGLADGKTMTTHWWAYDQFKQDFPNIKLQTGGRYVHDGNLWSSAGISGGIDMAFAFVLNHWAPDIAKKVQGVMEYFPQPPFTRSEVEAAQPNDSA